MKKERNTWWLILAISGISTLAWFTNTYTPQGSMSLVFFILIFFTTVTFGLFISNNIRRSLLFSFGIVGFLLLRLLGLREFFYPLLLVASLVSLEVYLNKR